MLGEARASYGRSGWRDGRRREAGKTGRNGGKNSGRKRCRAARTVVVCWQDVLVMTIVLCAVGTPGRKNPARAGRLRAVPEGVPMQSENSAVHQDDEITGATLAHAKKRF